MGQTTLSVALEVKPESFAHLSGLLDELHDVRSTNPSGGKGPFAEFLESVPALHFMSISVFPGFDYDPLLVLEANFDGASGPFWAQLEAAIGSELRSYLSCCKRPLDEYGPLFDAITESRSRAPIAPYLEARALTPSVYHHGNRGMTRDRILAEFELFKATRTTIAANDGSYRKLSAAQIHRSLRNALVPTFPWLEQSLLPRIPTRESLGDWFNLASFIGMIIFALSLPGFLLSLLIPTSVYLLTLGVVLLVFLVWFNRMAGTLPTVGLPAVAAVTILLAIFLLGTSTIAAPIAMTVGRLTFRAAWISLLCSLGLAVASLPIIVLGLLIWLRSLERADGSADAPPVDPRMLREMARREDWIPQNHMGSIVLIKPGILRAILIRVGHRGLGLVLRVAARDGYLGSMRTIHFAHWAMVNNKSRLLFLSNFDQTWESYLDDFIEKAHGGLTLAWSCGVGFPPTRFLFLDGASHGSQFKEWARHSMAVSRFWYSAYKDLTTDQIERNYRIALGLRKRVLSEKEAKLWITDL